MAKLALLWQRYGWHLYCGLLCLAGGVQCLRKIMSDSGGPGARYGPLTLALGLSLLVLLARRRQAWGRRSGWLVLLWLLASAQVALLILLLGALALAWPVVIWLLLLTLALLPVPALYQLWRYVYSGEVPWPVKSGTE